MSTEFPPTPSSVLRANDYVRGLIGAGVRAQAGGDLTATIQSLTSSFEAFKSEHNGRLGQLEASIDAQLGKAAFAQLGGPGLGGIAADDPAYTETFAGYMRHGDGESDLKKANASGHRAQIRAAMSVGTPGDGGYLAPVEWDRQVRKAQALVSPMRRLATVITTGVSGFTTIWNANNWGSGWVGETAARPATSGTTLSPLTFASGEIYANPAVTQQLIDDSQLNFDEWLSQEIADEFARQEGIAFISGNGVNKPFGLLSYVTGGAGAGLHPSGNLTTVNSGHATQVTSDGLVDFAYSLPAPYRQGASWLMSSTTAAAISKMKDGQGNYIWRESLLAGQPSTLLGYPVEIDEGMPAVAAGNLAVAFGNFARGYLINDRAGIRLLRDPYTNKPYVNFYTTKRVGAGLLDPNAIRLLKISA